MATAIITMTAACAGGNHLTVTVRINGGAIRTFGYSVDDMREPITTEAIQDTELLMARFHCAGMTRAQAKTALQAGITVATS